jgi:hypothetical protein
MRRIAGLTSAAALVAAGALVAASGSPARQAPQRLALLASDQHCAAVDAGHRRDHLGALTTCAATVRPQAGGAAIGRARWLCTYLGSQSAGDDCVATVRLANGTLRLSGPLSHTSARSTWVVAGGTGSFAGARGTTAIRQIDDDRTAATVDLLP